MASSEGGSRGEALHRHVYLSFSRTRSYARVLRWVYLYVSICTSICPRFRVLNRESVNYSGKCNAIVFYTAKRSAFDIMGYCYKIAVLIFHYFQQVENCLTSSKELPVVLYLLRRTEAISPSILYVPKLFWLNNICIHVSICVYASAMVIGICGQE